VPDAQRTYRPPGPLDLRLTLGPLRRGARDPCTRIEAARAWRATRTPDGPATTSLTVCAPHGEVRVESWGPGAAWAVEAAPALLGALDDPDRLVPRHRLVGELIRRFPGLRLGRAQVVTEVLVPTILEQKVIGKEARTSYRSLVLALGEPAPGPGGELGLFVPPAPATLAATPSWQMHPWGVERKRADTIRAAAGAWRRLEDAVAMAPQDAMARLQAVRGVGPWSAAEVARVALGDPDAVSVGDFHLPHQICWALAGRARGDDAVMLELLEPYAGQRGRVQRLVEAAGITAPRFGPRLALRAVERH